MEPDMMFNWATPLLVLPGVGLLVMSTGVRYARLHDEFHHHRHGGLSKRSLSMLLERGQLFRNALLALYGACCLLATAGLVGSVALPHQIASTLSGAGVVALVVACVLLMRETTVSLDILRAEAEGSEESEVVDEPSGALKRP